MASEDPLRAIYYHGEVVNGNPEGFGTMKYSDGSEFTGMFLDDAPGGLGVLNGIGDGTMFVGNVSGHRPHGFGVFFHRKNELGHQPLTLGNFVHGVSDGFQITLSALDRAAQKDIAEVIDGKVAGKGMRTSLGPGHPNPIVPNIFQIIDGEPVFSKEKLLKFGEFPYYNRIGSLGPRNEDS